MNPVTIELPVALPCSARLDATSAVAHRLLDGIGSLRQWDHKARCWLFPRNRVADLLAFAKATRRPVVVVDVDR